MEEGSDVEELHEWEKKLWTQASEIRVYLTQEMLDAPASPDR